MRTLTVGPESYSVMHRNTLTSYNTRYQFHFHPFSSKSRATTFTTMCDNHQGAVEPVMGKRMTWRLVVVVVVECYDLPPNRLQHSDIHP